jgi:ClpX C4-type zinc finger
MTVDEEMLRRARAADAHLAGAEKAAAMARAEYNTLIRRIHLGGASLREIAAALGMSHQRVQQIVDDAGGSWWKPRTRDMVCTFCGRPPSEVLKLIRGPNVFICDRCVADAERALAGASGAALTLAAGGKAACSFCGKRRSPGKPMTLGPSSNVCDACVGLCRQILADDRTTG